MLIGSCSCDAPLQAHHRLAQFEAPPLLYYWLEEASDWSLPFWLDRKAGPRVSSSLVFSALRDPAPWDQNRVKKSLKMDLQCINLVCDSSSVFSPTHQGRFEAARTNTRSLERARPSIWTRSSVFILLLPSCSPLRGRTAKKWLIMWLYTWINVNSVKLGKH